MVKISPYNNIMLLLILLVILVALPFAITGALDVLWNDGIFLYTISISENIYAGIFNAIATVIIVKVFLDKKERSRWAEFDAIKKGLLKAKMEALQKRVEDILGLEKQEIIKRITKPAEQAVVEKEKHYRKVKAKIEFPDLKSGSESLEYRTLTVNTKVLKETISALLSVEKGTSDPERMRRLVFVYENCVSVSALMEEGSKSPSLRISLAQLYNSIETYLGAYQED